MKGAMINIKSGCTHHDHCILQKSFHRQCSLPCTRAFARRTRELPARASSGEYDIPEEEVTGSEAWRSRRKAQTLPSLARTPEQTFVLAGVLKILLLASTFPAAYIFKPLGKTPHGFTAYLLLIPFGIGLSYLAGALNQAKFMRRKWSGLVVVLSAALLLTGLGFLYDERPEPVKKPNTPSVSQPVESHWSQDLFKSSRPRSAEDSEKIWKALEKEGVV